MAVLLNGKLKYIGNHIYYHFTDEFGCRQRLSLALKVDSDHPSSPGILQKYDKRIDYAFKSFIGDFRL